MTHRGALAAVILWSLAACGGPAPVEPDTTQPDKPVVVVPPDQPDKPIKPPEPEGPFVEKVPAPNTPTAGESPIDIPAAWLEAPRDRLAHFKPGMAPPPVIGEDWSSGTPFRFGDNRGKVVLVVFWASWSKPSLKALGIANNVYRELNDDGLVVVGVCASRGSEHAKMVHEKIKVEFPTCIDHEDRTANRYAVDGYPDFYIVDKWGRLRVADVASAHLNRALKALLNE